MFISVILSVVGKKHFLQDPHLIFTRLHIPLKSTCLQSIIPSL